MSKEQDLIDVFISRPNWLPPELESALSDFYSMLEDLWIYPNTIGISQSPLQTPFDDIVKLMERCKCVIILALPQIQITSGAIKENSVSNISLPTEWNQIETAIALSLKKPMLILLHKDVEPRGLLEKGAANVYIHNINPLGNDWPNGIRDRIKQLTQAAS